MAGLFHLIIGVFFSIFFIVMAESQDWLYFED